MAREEGGCPEAEDPAARWRPGGRLRGKTRGPDALDEVGGKQAREPAAAGNLRPLICSFIYFLLFFWRVAGRSDVRALGDCRQKSVGFATVAKDGSGN